jgi:hypothetical protein
MSDRRRWPRRKIWRGRLWLAGRWQRWVELLDSSDGGARISLPGAGLEPGEPVIVHTALGEFLGRGRAGRVVHVTGMSAGLRYDLDRDPGACSTC